MITRYAGEDAGKETMRLIAARPDTNGDGIEHDILKIRKDMIKNYPDWFNTHSRVLQLTGVSLNKVMEKFSGHVYNTVIVVYHVPSTDASYITNNLKPSSMYVITDEYKEDEDDDCNEHIILV
jgi:hypothetical protein